MGIGSYIRHIARKHSDGRDLSRQEAADLMGQLLDGRASDIELGAFCIAMRLKGETAEEFAGFLDATNARLAPCLSSDAKPVVVIPSYNGARKHPVLTPLLGLMLARRGVTVLMHGMATESVRITSQDVLQELGIAPVSAASHLSAGTFSFISTEMLCPGLARVLAARRATGLRNSGHSIAKMLNPVHGKSLLLSSYTHGEYTDPMADALKTHQMSVLLFHGLEGEVIAEERRLGETLFLLQGLPQDIGSLEQSASASGRGLGIAHQDALLSKEAMAAWTRSVLDGQEPIPTALTAQLELIERAIAALS